MSISLDIAFLGNNHPAQSIYLFDVYLRLGRKWFCFLHGLTLSVFSGLGEGPDLARGEGNVETSSSSEDEDIEEEAGEEGKNLQTTIKKK